MDEWKLNYVVCLATPPVHYVVCLATPPVHYLSTPYCLRNEIIIGEARDFASLR